MSNYLGTYCIRVREAYSQDHWKFLNNLDGNGYSFLNFLDDVFQRLNNRFSSDDATRKTLLYRSINRECSETRRGIIEAGEFGFSQSIVDTQDGSEVFQVEPHHSGMMPFYFLFGFSPDDNTKGFLFLEKFKNYSCKEAFENDLKAFLRQRFNGELILQIEHAVPRDLIESFYNTSAIEKIKITSFGLFSDISDSVEGDWQGEYKIEFKPSIKAANGNVIQTLRNFLTTGSLQPQNQLFLFNQENLRPDKIWVTLNINGHNRTINLADPLQRFHPFFDITDEILIDQDNGHPTFTSIDNIAMQFYRDFRGTIFVDVDEN